MWAIRILRSYITTAHVHYFNLVAERKFHGLPLRHISRDRILPFVPRYSQVGVLGRSNGRDHVPWKLPLLVMAPGWEFAYGSDSEGTSETGENRKVIKERSGESTGFMTPVHCSSKERRRWEVRRLNQPTRRFVNGAESVLHFRVAYLLDLSTVLFCPFETSRPNVLA